MINFTVYSADCAGNSGNCLYPNKNVVTDKESFIAATKMDHVTAKYKGNYSNHNRRYEMEKLKLWQKKRGSGGVSTEKGGRGCSTGRRCPYQEWAWRRDSGLEIWEGMVNG